MFSPIFAFQQYQIKLLLSTLEFKQKNPTPSLGAQRKKPPVSRGRSKPRAGRAVTPVPAAPWPARSPRRSRSPRGRWLRTTPPRGARRCRKPTTATTTPSSSPGPGIGEALATGEANTCSAWQMLLAFCFPFSFLVYCFE